MATERTREGSLHEVTRVAAEFASDCIAPRSGLSASLDFPMDLWRDMGAAGLLGIGIPGEYGGSGLGYPGISAAGTALARHGRCLGITLSWLMHNLVARFFLCTFATREQKQASLPAMSRGEKTASVAISEPQAGGHPKHLRTAMERVPGGYVLRGEKTFLTNGPMADLFIVLAVSGHEGARKQFTAGMVPRGCRGLEVSSPVDPGFLRPCPHGGITLDGCVVPEGALLGTVGTAYEDMALPFREVEDTAMMGPVLGAQGARFDGIVAGLRQRPGPVTGEMAFRLGGLYSALCALDVLAREAATRLEAAQVTGPVQPLVIAFRTWCGQVHREIAEVTVQADIRPAGAHEILCSDLDRIVSFAGRVSRLRQIRIGAGSISETGWWYSGSKLL